jgi:hypothetical protein
MNLRAAIIVIVLAVGCACERNPTRQTLQGGHDSNLSIVEEWEPLTSIRGIDGDLAVRISSSDSSKIPTNIANDRSYFETLARLSYRLRRGQMTTCDSIDYRQEGSWHLDTMSFRDRDGSVYYSAIVYLQRGSSVNFPGIVIVERSRGSAVINMDIVGSLSIKKQCRYTADKSLSGCTSYQRYASFHKRMDSIAHSLASEYYRKRGLELWTVY